MLANELLPRLAKAVKDAHEESGLTASGHDFDHDLRVAAYALMISPTSDRTGLLAAAAGFCHSADRILGSRSSGGLESKKATDVEFLVRRWLDFTDLADEEKDEVVATVMSHEAKNLESDTPVQVALKDADRLANLDADVIIRGGQFQPHLLALDTVYLERNPKATYRDPGSVLWDIANCVSWTKEGGPYVLRLPKAKELGKARGAFLQLFIDTVRKQRNEIGLIPYPDI